MNLRNFVIMHTKFVQALGTLERKYQQISHLTASTGITLTGPTGSGKTSLLTNFIKRHESETKRTSEGLICPIISVTVPAYPAMKPFLASILSELGDPPHGRNESIEKVTKRLITLIHNCGIKVLILEEFQHFLIGRDAKLNQTADLLKTIMDKTKILLIVSGLRETTQLLSVNTQLGRRCSARLELKRFNWNTPHEREEFIAIMESFKGKILSEGWQLPSLPWNELIWMFHAASDGNICHVKALLVEAIDVCLFEKRQSITIHDLHAAWYDIIQSVLPDGQNPFVFVEHTEPEPVKTKRKSTAKAKQVVQHAA